MDINDRYMKLVDSVSSSRAEFSKRTGISSVILSHIGSGRNKVSLTAVISLLENYDDINPEYLLLGKGKPFKEGDKVLKDEILTKVEGLDALVQQQNGQLKAALRSLRDHIEQV